MLSLKVDLQLIQADRAGACRIFLQLHCSEIKQNTYDGGKSKDFKRTVTVQEIHIRLFLIKAGESLHKSMQYINVKQYVA